MERVLKGAPWTFNNHLLMFHQLEKGEDPLKARFVFAKFWVQIYDVPSGLIFEALAKQMGDFIGWF